MKPSVKALHRCLKAIGQAVEQQILFMNSGGCGIYAVELAKRLKELGYSPVIKAYGCRSQTAAGSVENMLRAHGFELHQLANWNIHGVYFDHVVVQLGRYVWDSTGSVPKNNSRHWRYAVMQRGSVSIAAMEQLCSSYKNWNRTYDRSQTVRVQAIMDTHFNMLKSGHFSKGHFCKRAQP